MMPHRIIIPCPLILVDVCPLSSNLNDHDFLISIFYFTLIRDRISLECSISFAKFFMALHEAKWGRIIPMFLFTNLINYLIFYILEKRYLPWLLCHILGRAGARMKLTVTLTFPILCDIAPHYGFQKVQLELNYFLSPYFYILLHF